MYQRIINRIKREVSSFLSNIFKNKISISTNEGNEIVCLLNDAFFTFEEKQYTYIGIRPYWMDFKNIKLRNLYLKELKDVEVIERGIIIDSVGFVVLESCIFQLEYLYNLKSNHWVFFRKLLPFKTIENAIVLTNGLDNNYYHWLLEGIGRLALVDANELKNRSIVIRATAPKFVIDSLITILDIDPDKIYLKSTLRLKVSTVLIPSFPQTRDDATSWTNLYPPKVIQQINILSKKKTYLKTEKKNFIISRKKAIQRRILNHEIILEKFERLSFEIVFLEDLSLLDQMQLFRNAGIILATHGAGLTNLLFAEDPFIIELFPSNRNNRDGFYFYQLSNALNFNHNLIEYETKNTKQDLFIDEKILRELDKVISKYKW